MLELDYGNAESGRTTYGGFLGGGAVFLGGGAAFLGGVGGGGGSGTIPVNLLVCCRKDVGRV